MVVQCQIHAINNSLVNPNLYEYVSLSKSRLTPRGTLHNVGDEIKEPKGNLTNPFGFLYACRCSVFTIKYRPICSPLAISP